MKRSKIFPAILYFVFTFLVGIFIAVFLPAIYLYSGLLLDTMSDGLYSGNYEEAIKVVGGYYDKEPVYLREFEKGGGFVLFETATLSSQDAGAGDEEQKSILQKSHVGFLFGVKDEYQTDKASDNKTNVLVTVNGEDKSYPILDADTDGDGNPDGILTYIEKGLVLLELTQKEFSQMEGLKFVDCDGNVKYEFTFDAPISYDTPFFNDLNDIIAGFNAAEEDSVLVEKEKIFLSANENNKKYSYETAEKAADKKSTRTVMIYFVVVYVLADFLFTHFIIKFIKFLLFKVFKIKPKEKPMKVHNESFGNDYYCAVTLKADNKDTGFDQTITVSYRKDVFEAFDEVKDEAYKPSAEDGIKTDGDDGALVFVLTPEENYEKYLRVKAGTYGNLQTEVPDGYQVEGLPETLIVDGYKKTITVKIVRRED